MHDVDKRIQRLEFARARLNLREPWYQQGLYTLKDSEVHNNVTIGENVTIGKGCLIRSGTVIGEAGFSFGFDEDNLPVPIVHTGGVIIGDHVRIGTNCNIMRATINYTILDNHVQLDNDIHIAHNCFIGKGTCIACSASIAGSAKIGELCWIGPNATIMNGVTLGRMVLVGIGSNVINDVPDYAIVAGNPAKVRYFHDGSIHPGAIGRKHNGS
jgi:UDP-3-O-[3-hydroxymyristoyl] glucosamine N-acyltransferase LpxD